MTSLQEHQAGTLQEREAAIRRRISSVTELEASHYPTSPAWCSCGRPEPCPVVLGCRQARDAQSRELAHVRRLPTAETVVLPKVHDEEPQRARASASGTRPRLFGPLRALSGRRKARKRR